MPIPQRTWMLPALASSIVVLSSALTLGLGQSGSTPAATSVAPPAPYGTLPSERQVRWHELETYAFLHFTTNTFTDKEWGYGDEQPSIFNPTAFDADKIVTALKAGGMRGVILTAKHHDGYQPVGEDGGPPAPGFIKTSDAPVGHRTGSQWIPAECDVSIRPGWFWHAAENSKVKTAAQLVDLYYQSVGRGCSLLLNVPPDRRGLLDETDAASLARFGEIVNATFKVNLAAGATLIPSNVRGGKTTASAGPFAARNLIDTDRATYWATDDHVKTPELIVDFNGTKTFSVVRLRENIRLGQRVEAFALDAWTGGDWKEIATATSIGPSRLIRLTTPQTTSRLRLRITKAPVSPALSELGVYLESQTR